MKVRKLTPAVLKRIIAEEKQKITKKRKPATGNKKTKQNIVENKIDQVTKLALQEVKILKLLKKVRKERNRIKSSVSKLSKK